MSGVGWLGGPLLSPVLYRPQALRASTDMLRMQCRWDTRQGLLRLPYSSVGSCEGVRNVLRQQDIVLFEKFIGSPCASTPHVDRIGFDEFVSINGEPLDEEELEDIRERVYEWVDNCILRAECTFCATPYRRKEVAAPVNQLPIPFGHSGIGREIIEVWSCPRCGHWQHEYTLTDGNGDDEFARVGVITVAKVRAFGDASPEGAMEELAQHLRQRPKLWHEISPGKLEELVTSIFADSQPGARAYHVGRPDDGGVDVVFVDAEQRQWLVQVKRRERPTSSEGVETLRSLLAGVYG